MNVLEVVMCPHAMCCPYLMECRLSLLYLFLSLTTPAPSTCKSVLSIYLMDYYLTFKIDEEYSVFLSSFVPKTPTLVLVLCYVSYYSKHIHIKKKITFLCMDSCLSPIRPKFLRASTVYRSCRNPVD